MKKRKPVATILVCLIGLSMVGCRAEMIALGLLPGAGDRIDNAISRHNAVSHLIKIGDSKEKVLDILLPPQEGLPPNARKHHESVVKEGQLIEVYYMRTGRNPDGLTTDDEFTPYVFVDGVLVAIGWTAQKVLSD